MLDLLRTHGASNETVRDYNRRVVLNLIRTQKLISRADLARLCGLQRSTISLIVEQLMEENWVLEGPTGRLPRGRRPTFLRLNEDRVIIGVDVRPILTTVAISGVNGAFHSHESLPTPPDAETGVRQLIDRIQRAIRCCAGKKIEGIGISLPGRVSQSADRLVFAPNLRWPAVDLRTPISKATGLPVQLDNAANACVLAAVWFDRMESCANLVVVTVSEGIGTGILMGGRLLRGMNGMAGEFGHVPLDINGPPCTCGSNGCWEVFGSNRAALRYYGESGPAREDLTFTELLSLADAGDTRAAEALERMARYLGKGMRMLVAGLAPERIVIVGDLTRSWDRFGPMLEREVRQQSLSDGCVPRVIGALEDDTARLRGTIALVLQRDFGFNPEVPPTAQ
ncbi:MAG TPA: ROK family protein [Bryobacteraceae bacterium]|nr:ROK family protein [Bryobacteraceae bacterium]